MVAYGDVGVLSLRRKKSKEGRPYPKTKDTQNLIKRFS